MLLGMHTLNGRQFSNSPCRYKAAHCMFLTSPKRDFGLPQRRWELRSSGSLRSEWWQFLTDVSGQPNVSHLKESKNQSWDPIGWTETSIKSYKHSLRNSPDERSSQHARCTVDMSTDFSIRRNQHLIKYELKWFYEGNF